MTAPPAPDTTKYRTDKKITDPEILKILEEPLARSTGAKGKNKKKKKKKAAKKEEVEADEEDSSSED